MNGLICSKKKKFESFLVVGLALCNLLFLVYWGALSTNYCLHYDDVHFMWKMKEYSIFQYVKEMYLTRGGNFVGYGTNGIIFSLSNLIGDYHFWPLVYYFLGIAMCFYSVKDLIKGVESWKILLGVSALYNIYILTVPDYAVFTWLCAMGYFTTAPVMCLMLKLVNEKTLNWWKWTLIALFALRLSGSNVTITPMMWLLMFANLVWVVKKNNWKISDSWKSAVVRRIVFISLGMLAVYVVVLVAPGNWARLEDGTDMNHPTRLVEYGLAWVKCIATFFYFMAFYLPYHTVALILGFFAGVKAPSLIKNRRRAMVVVIVSFLIYLAIAVLPLAYLSNGFGIQRNYTHITFFYLLMFSLVGFVFGNTSEKGYALVSMLGTANAVFLCGIMAFNLYHDIPLTVAYKKAHEERELFLKDLQNKGNKETVFVEKFPSTRTLDAKHVVLKLFGKTTSMQTIYYESDASAEPNEYERHMRHLFDLDFDFVLYNEKE